MQKNKVKEFSATLKNCCVGVKHVDLTIITEIIEHKFSIFGFKFHRLCVKQKIPYVKNPKSDEERLTNKHLKAIAKDYKQRAENYIARLKY